MITTHETAEPIEPRRRDGQNRSLCSAHRSDGQPCNAPAMTGQRVCARHGGNTPQARQAATRRLAVLADEAVSTLASVLHDPDVPPRVKVAAADSILDRTGHPRGRVISTNDAHAQLVEQLLELRDEIDEGADDE